MRRKIELQPRADADIEHYLLYLSQESLDVLDAVRDTVSAIAE